MIAQGIDLRRACEGTMKPEYAEALRALDVGGQPVRASAATRGLSANNAGVRVFRAREALRRRVAQWCGSCAEHGCVDCSYGKGSPGEPGGDTWGDLPLVFRAGGDMWVSGSYDPETNLIYWSTAQAKPWARNVRGTGDGAALYTNCTLALDPDTYKMKWYYQHIPGETQDTDEVFERILIDVGGRKSMFTMGKLAILSQLDRVTGAFVHAYDMGYQNILKVDPQSGKVTYNPGMIPEIGVPLDMCPNTAGFKAQRAMAYHPQTSAFYIPILMSCENAIFGPVERVRGWGGNRIRRRLFFSRSPSSRFDQLGAFPEITRQVRKLRRCGPSNPGLGHRSQMLQVGSASSRSERLACRQSTATVAHRLPRMIIITYDTLVASRGWP